MSADRKDFWKGVMVGLLIAIVTLICLGYLGVFDRIDSPIGTSNNDISRR